VGILPYITNSRPVPVRRRGRRPGTCGRTWTVCAVMLPSELVVPVTVTTLPTEYPCLRPPRIPDCALCGKITMPNRRRGFGWSFAGRFGKARCRDKIIRPLRISARPRLRAPLAPTSQQKTASCSFGTACRRKSAAPTITATTMW